MSWLEQMGFKERRGSRPRCVLLMDGGRDEVAGRLTQLVGLPGDVVIAPSDSWMPYGKPVRKEDGSWDREPTAEARLDRENCLVHPYIQNRLRKWWLVNGGNTPNWDIAASCRILGKKGILLVEAKAHSGELEVGGKGEGTASNHERIGRAIDEANEAFQCVTGREWGLSRDSHYQLSNRFAWSWKLASLGIPVVLVYLGFLNAQDMANDGEPFECEAQWKSTLDRVCTGVVDHESWGQWLKFGEVPMIPLVRAANQPLKPSINAKRDACTPLRGDNNSCD